MEPYKDLSRSIAGHTALVTGAASGMGRATAHLFASQGANVAVTDLDQAKCDAVAAEIAQAGYAGQALPMALDVTDAAAIDSAIARTVEKFGGLDIVVNNAGFAKHAMIEDEHYPQVWGASLDAMLSAHANIIRAAMPHLRASEHPRIVNIASTEGLGATPGNSPYVAAKHGVIGLTRGMAVDLGRDGITCNCVCPGPIRTGITDGIPEEHKTIYAKRRVPMRRYGFPEEVAQMTLNLVLPSASFV
ncbi:MAG: SDR family oxidoreductase, partial [Erythrobacter sp.]|nr:SDR family oxidoreductase [Erythrobacter sp.]